MESGSETRQAQSSGSPSILHRVNLGKFGFPKEVLVGGVVMAVVAGGLTGYILSSRSVGSAGQQADKRIGVSVKSGVKTAGVSDKKAFPDCTKGQLEQGGVNGEGTHHLVREGGPSRTAYLLSSVVDLDLFVGKMVDVCGKSIGSRRVAWLMDVGYVSVVE